MSALPPARYGGFVSAAIRIKSLACRTEKPSAADFAWGTSLRELRNGSYGFLRADLAVALPHVLRFSDAFLALPAVRAYYKD